MQDFVNPFIYFPLIWDTYGVVKELVQDLNPQALYLSKRISDARRASPGAIFMCPSSTREYQTLKLVCCTLGVFGVFGAGMIRPRLSDIPTD